jgi:hypothetical protein
MLAAKKPLPKHKCLQGKTNPQLCEVQETILASSKLWWLMFILILTNQQKLYDIFGDQIWRGKVKAYLLLHHEGI